MSKVHVQPSDIVLMVYFAEKEAQNLKSEAIKDIEKGLQQIHSALNLTTLAIENALETYYQRFSLQILQTNSKKAQIWQKCFEDITRSVDVGVSTASNVLSCSQSYYLATLDLVNSTIRPTKQYLQNTAATVKSNRQRVTAELKSTRLLKEVAEKQIDSTQRSIWQGQTQITAYENKMENNSRKLGDLRLQILSCKKSLEAESASAERDREDARDKRSNAPWWGLVTFGIAAVVLTDEANSLERTASRKEDTCRSLQEEIDQSEAESSRTQQDTVVLSAEIQTLEMTGNQLKSKLHADQAAIVTLELQIADLIDKEADAKSFLQTAEGLSKFAHSVESHMQLLLHQLLVVKQRMDDLKARLDVNRDYGVRKLERRRKLCDTKEGRDQAMRLLAHSMEDLQAVKKDIQDKCGKLLEF